MCSLSETTSLGCNASSDVARDMGMFGEFTHHMESPGTATHMFYLEK